jgi:membrane-bound inhibitor of C-type lysozyme
MRRKNILTLIVLVVLLILAALLGNLSKKQYVVNTNTDIMASDAVTYTCDDTKWITALYHLPEDQTIDLSLSDGRTLTLSHTLSGSGARYANDDESIVFWNKGNGAFIEENGATTFVNCVDNKTLEETSPVENATPPTNTTQQTSMSGTYVCLPHKNTSGPTTMECAFGLKADSGYYYALDMSGLSQTVTNALQTGQHITVIGTLVPKETISSNLFDIYNIVGVIRVTSTAKA